MCRKLFTIMKGETCARGAAGAGGARSRGEPAGGATRRVPGRAGHRGRRDARDDLSGHGAGTRRAWPGICVRRRLRCLGRGHHRRLAAQPAAGAARLDRTRLRRAFIRRSALLRGRPVADIRALIEELYQTTFPMDFAAVLASPVEFHPLATDAATGQSTDLRPLCGTPADLRLALRASAALPLLAGPPVQLDGRRFYDAGLSEAVPYRTALAQGATHVLVLRSRRGPIAVLED